MPEVNVLIPSLLRPVTGGREELRLDVEAAGATLADLLDAIGAQYPVFNRRVRDETGSLRRFVNIYLDGDDVRRLDGLKTRVAAGSEVMVMQSVAGG
ncbi:MoaD/ThiS family protein [Arthrobacter wenxiniae]|jgi:molybdopterin converting factor small subunit|uniref:MoaD/ThiS family protein n=1 Tax=Arthrobacter wenxiniae TaxID=2713570 RepID=A0A7Y7IIH0_9MICC|nr:MoaD/ThiS family protein [Arthrobacter wenxiniae]NVM95923.1 MoaD/ThiS family protein [Arthrobacter wenxiniae]